MPNKDKNLLDEVNEYANLWNDSASWVTAPRAKVNISSSSKYKNKLQKLIDYHITDTAAHDAKAHGRWKPTANMNIKALDETADSAFLTFTETCYRGQAGIAEDRMIDAFYDKQTKKFKILFFLNKKLIIRKEGAGFNDMMEELCFFFRSPKFGTPERQDLMEWVDKNGTNINLNGVSTTPTGKSTSNSTASPVKSTSTSQPPVKVTKPFKRKQVKNKFGCLIDNWRPEFNKLGLHIWDTCKKPADEKDSMVGPSILRIYFEMSNGEEWRLEVTNTGITLNKGIQVYVDWDYVISTDRNGKEVIISRGKTKDYNEFLDILLSLGIVSDKKKCV
jgi:hypothetical protein